MRILVTGTSAGIGRALASRLLSRGHEVWGLARSDQAELAGQYPDRFRFLRCDVADWAQMTTAAATVEDEWPWVDAIVTCAGSHGEIKRALEADPKLWSAAVRSNLDATYYAMRAFADLLGRAPRRKKVVCFSGGGATKARAHFSAYGAAKTAIVRLVETIAEEESGTPLDINAIAPGAIDTRLTDEILHLGEKIVGKQEYASALNAKAGGPAVLEKALDLVEWLLSPASDGISGRLISAPWDPWPLSEKRASVLSATDIYTLRRIVPQDRGVSLDNDTPFASGSENLK